MRLAVIMSLYKNDRIENLKLAVESILNQTYTQFDFYIQFDGIIKKECEDYLKSIKDSRVCVSERNDNRGLAKSLNELLRCVLPKGYKYIARMDADDISLPKRFEKQISFLESNKDIDSLGSWAIEINAHGEEYFRKQMPETHEACLDIFQIRDCYIHPSVTFRNTYFEKAGFYPEDTYFGEDTIMWAQGFANGCKFSNFPDYLIKFRLDEDFFKRRRGWKHAKSIYSLRGRVNNLLGFGFKARVYAIMYSGAKLMPTFILNIIYKTIR